MSNESDAKNQVAAQLDLIKILLAATKVDYARLDELKEELADITYNSRNVATWSNSGEYMALMVLANECTDEAEARQAVYDSPLSVEVRAEWHAQGERNVPPNEFQILLCTSGPAVRILGEFCDGGVPCDAHLEYSDWGTPCTDYHDRSSEDTLLEYAAFFFEGF